MKHHTYQLITGLNHQCFRKLILNVEGSDSFTDWPVLFFASDLHVQYTEYYTAY